MDRPLYLQEVPDGIVISVKVQPRARRNEIVGTIGSELKIKIKNPPVDSAANEGLVEFLAETLGLQRSTLQIIRGTTSQHKKVLVREMKLQDFITALRKFSIT
jgi:uncharacterized protein